MKIGHASIDENRKTTGGEAGDQSGGEVCTRAWYNGGWAVLARPRDSAVAEKIAAACEAGCANTSIGYDQNQRNTLYTQARAVDFDLAKIANACETDCSAFVAVCVRAALGEDFYTGNAPTTGTLKNVLSGTGAFDILTDSKYLTMEKYLRRGDILIKPGHTVMVLEDGSAAGESVTALPLLKKGATGDSVRALQILLTGWGYDCGKAGIDGDFGSGTENAVEAFQEDNDLEPDGECGPKTWAKLLGM